MINTSNLKTYGRNCNNCIVLFFFSFQLINYTKSLIIFRVYLLWWQNGIFGVFEDDLIVYYAASVILPMGWVRPHTQNHPSQLTDSPLLPVHAGVACTKPPPSPFLTYNTLQPEFFAFIYVYKHAVFSLTLVVNCLQYLYAFCYNCCWFNHIRTICVLIL